MSFKANRVSVPDDKPSDKKNARKYEKHSSSHPREQLLNNPLVHDWNKLSSLPEDLIPELSYSTNSILYQYL